MNLETLIGILLGVIALVGSGLQVAAWGASLSASESAEVASSDTKSTVAMVARAFRTPAGTANTAETQRLAFHRNWAGLILNNLSIVGAVLLLALS